MKKIPNLFFRRPAARREIEERCDTALIERGLDVQVRPRPKVVTIKRADLSRFKKS